jgi:hypothetical protein
MPTRVPLAPASRDRAIRRLRVVTWTVAGVAAATATGLSVVAAHAFKGHATTRAVRRPPRVAVRVPPPQQVPAISGAPAPLAPPPAPPVPTAAPVEPAPVSGAS